MKAGAVTPGQKGSARLLGMDVPLQVNGEALVRILEVGIDGTDIEMAFHS